MFPMPESICFNSYNSASKPIDFPEVKTQDFGNTTGGTNWSPDWPFTYVPIEHWPTTVPTPPTVIISPTVYPQPIIIEPIKTGDPIELDMDVEIVVLPKDPIKKRNTLRELLKEDQPTQGDEHVGRRIDLGTEEIE